MLEFCARCRQLDRLNYVSTAYVAGKRTGTVYEHELILGQQHKNHYESTKFQAEVWVRETMDKVPTTVYRPAIVVGDSQTGETASSTGRTTCCARSRARQAAAGPVRPLRRAVQRRAARLHRRRDRRRRGDEPEAVGETLHLVDPGPGHRRRAVRRCWPRSTRTASRRSGCRRSWSQHTLQVPAFRKRSRCPARVDRVPEPPGQLRHPPRRPTSWPATGCAVRVSRSMCGPMVKFFREHEDDPKFVPA